MNRYLIAVLLLVTLAGVSSCAARQLNTQQADGTQATPPKHADERHLSGDLYMHGRHIHHHPERDQAQPADTTEDKAQEDEGE